MRTAVFLFSFIFSFLASAAIPKASMILQRTVENSGSGYYQVDQEVQFQSGQDPIILKESWMIEDHQNMKVHVSGVREFKDQVSFVITIQNGVRTFAGQNRRFNDDFVEKYFHVRSLDFFSQFLNAQKMAPPNSLVNKPVRNLKEIDFSPEQFVRLGRTQGIIAYVFGSPSTLENPEAPGLWIEQDQFVIRKLRLQSGVEITADRYSTFARGFQFPRTRTIRWGGQQMTIQTLNVGPRNKVQYQNFAAKVVNKPESIQLLPQAVVIEDFYKRLR